MPTINARVIDISHYNSVASDGFKKAAAFGIWGVINKVTESTGYVDQTYAARRQAVKDAGLLWGAYHFVRPGSMSAQVEHFLRHAAPDDATLLALDWEVSTVSVAAAREFLQRIIDRTGRKAVIYSGHTAKEMLGNVADTFFGSHRLWHAQYSSAWTVQKSWKSPWIWQFSGDNLGPLPHGLPGFTLSGKQICDMNHYGGTRDELAAEWVEGGAPSRSDPVPASPFIEPSAENVKKLQATLNKLGASPALVEDGNIGPRTFTAIVRTIEAK